MLEPGVVRFGLGPLTEVVAQQHTFAELAPHLDSSLLAVVAQERVLRGEDLRADVRAQEAGADVPLVLHPFEPTYRLPEYRADERLDGAFALPATGWQHEPVRAVHPATQTPATQTQATQTPAAGPGQVLDPALGRVATETLRALRATVEVWATDSDATIVTASVTGSALGALQQVLAELPEPTSPGRVPWRTIQVPELFGLLAFAGASGGVHGRRRGAAAGRALAWWVARAATDLPGAGVQGHAEDPVRAQELLDELEFRLEDLERVAFVSHAAAAWRLELALAAPAGGWAVAISALERPIPADADAVADTGPPDRVRQGTMGPEGAGPGRGEHDE
jgi:hypothetical protein